MSAAAMIKLAPAAALLSLGVLSVVLQQASRDPVPAEDWSKAAAHVIAQIKPDELVRAHPIWSEDALVHLRALRPEQLSRQDHPVAEDVQHASAVWIIAPTGRMGDALASLPFEAKPDASAGKTLGTLEIARVAVPGTLRARWEARAHLAGAKVAQRPIGGKGAETACSRWDATRQAWFCGGVDRHRFVGVATRELADDPRECVWTHPIAGKVVSVTLPDVPLTAKLRVRGGKTLRGGRLPGHRDVRWRVLIDGQQVLSQTERPWTSRWDAHELDTSAWRGKRATVRVEVESEADREHFFCWNAWAYGD